jgi:hypothetical protein
MTIPVCPIDGKEDAIRKIESIILGDTSFGSFSGPSGGVTYSEGKWGTYTGGQQLSGTSTTTLANMLRLPPEPVKRGGLGCWLFVIYFFGGIAAFAGIAMILGGLLGDGYANEGGSEVFCNAIGVAVIAIGGLILARSYNAKSKKDGEEKYARDIQIWRKMKDKWVGLYYCYRHHLVFDPNTGEQCQPENLLTFLQG